MVAIANLVVAAAQLVISLMAQLWKGMRPRPKNHDPMDEITFNEHGAAMLDQLETLLETEGRSPAGRDLALAKTHLEDALTRYNSAQYRIRGTWARQDPDRLAS